MAHTTQFGLAALFVAGSSLVGCQIVAGLTDLRPRKDSPSTSSAAGTGGNGGAGGDAVTSTGGSTSTGMGGQGGAASTGTGGTGGQGGGPTPECVGDDDCNDLDSDCTNGVCNAESKCEIELIAKGTACGQGKQCDDVGNCVDGGCVDGQKGENETDADCGGVCAKKCSNGKGCDAATDCASGYCDTASANPNGSAGSCAPCTLDDQCGPSEFCQLALGGKCVAKAANGAQCGGANGCTSDHCVDGVCCDTVCDGACEACSSTVDPSITSGTCGPVSDGKASKEDACGVYFCDGASGGCPTACAVDADCKKAAHCDKTNFVCEQDKAYGVACTFGNECIGAEYCVNLTCCQQMSCPEGMSCDNAEGTCK